jgi:hypothetical protein
MTFINLFHYCDPEIGTWRSQERFTTSDAIGENLSTNITMLGLGRKKS